MTPKQVVEFAKENGALMVDFKFMDFVGIWQHFSVPMSEFGEDTFKRDRVLTVRPSVAGSRFTPLT